MLDPKGREAARLWAINAASDGGVPGDDYIDGILTTYLSTITPAEVGGLVDAQTEARAIVSAALPPHEQAMLGGDAIVVLADLIATALTTERATHAETRRKEKESFQKYVDANEARIEAEAQRDEALKALEQRDTDIVEFMGRLGSRWFLEQGWFPASADTREDDARRALTRGSDD